MERFYSNRLKHSLWVPLVCVAVLLIEVLRDRSLQIIIEAWWIVPIVWLVYLVPLVPFRYVIIDSDSKTVVLRDGFWKKIVIRQDSLQSIENQLGNLKISYLHIVPAREAYVRDVNLNLNASHSPERIDYFVKKLREFSPKAS